MERDNDPEIPEEVMEALEGDFNRARLLRCEHNAYRFRNPQRRVTVHRGLVGETYVALVG